MTPNYTSGRRVGVLPLLLALAVTAIVVPLNAQQGRSSSEPAAAAPPAGQTAPPADGTPAGDLPVSLDRIREGLAKPAPGSTLKNLDLKPDFVVRIEERDHIQEILSKLEVKSGPTPLGGLYAAEQRDQIWNRTDRPLQQPYAAFSGGELITLAIEGLIQRYLGGKVIEGITAAQRASAERAARAEVAQAIADYCDVRPDGGRSLHLCTEVLSR